MNDEKNNENEDWRLDSLDEDEDIIELTDEIEPSPPPGSSLQDQLDEILIELEDDPTPAPDEQVSEFSEDEALFDLEEDPAPAPAEQVPEFTGDEAFVDLEEGPAPEDHEQVPELTEDAIEELGSDELQPATAAEEIIAPDIETEVDIAEVADLEPIQPDTDPDPDLTLQEELADDLSDSVGPPTDEIIEISEFDQQYFGKDDAEITTADLPTANTDEDEDYLELIDIEEGEDESAEEDDEIIYFDRIENEGDAIEMDALISEPTDLEMFPDSPVGTEAESAADLEAPFPADLLAGAPASEMVSEPEDFAEPEQVPSFFESSLIEEDIEIEAEEEISAQTDADDEPQAAAGDENDAAALPEAVSAAQIAAAVANIVERDYAGQIENMVAAAVEKVVTLEIERIKSRLFSSEEDETP